MEGDDGRRESARGMRWRASTGGEDVGAGEEKASTGGGVGAGWG